MATRFIGVDSDDPKLPAAVLEASAEDIATAVGEFIEPGGVQSVNEKTGDVVLTASDLGVEEGATANSSDADLRDRSTHTGTQAIDTIDGLDTALDGKLDTDADLPAAQLTGTIDDARIPASIARDSEVSSAISALSSVYQPLDSDLTAIAALTTTSFGRGLLELANAAAGRTALGLGSAATQASSAFDAAGAASSAQAYAIERSNHTGTQAFSTIDGTASIEQLPAGCTVDVYQASNGTWPERPTEREDIRVNYVGYFGDDTLPDDAIEGLDSYMYRAE